ncbi:hypothetical protein FOZ60_010698 [Perkinsus olseni]|uniref:FH2 domain-containing protein n=2 Tax=Perkinsus olseni TaxID=32597 RepID=A0A7J6PBH3_PEROL|nr:hypothetical protein FOZ60_010698 [Perkinsus olseni]
MTTVISQISKLLGRTSRLAYAAKKVNALGPQCKVEYLDSRMILARAADHYFATWEEPETPKRLLPLVTAAPFQWVLDYSWSNVILQDLRLMSELKAAFEGGMDGSKCFALIDYIERHPTRDYKDSADWVRKFVHDKMNEAMELADDDRKKNNPLAYREQSFAMGEKIDFTRDSVYTISATVQNDENNNSQLLNSITTQGPRFSDVDVSPKERIRVGGLGGLETIEEGQEDSRGSAHEMSGNSGAPVEPWRSSIAESEDLAGGIDGIECGSRCSIMSLPGQLPIAPPTSNDAGPLGNRIDRGRRPLSCVDAEVDEDFRPSLTLARAMEAYHSFGHVYREDTLREVEQSEVGNEQPEQSGAPQEKTEEVKHEDIQGGATQASQTVEPSPPKPEATLPQHGPSPPPPVPSAKGSPPIALPLPAGKGKNCKLIDEDTVPWCAEFVNEDELQNIFGQNATKVPGKSGGSRSGNAPARHSRKVLKLLEDKKSHLLAIAFRPLPQPDDLVKIIASGNVAALTGAQLSMLADEVPEQDFIEELHAMETRSQQEGSLAQWDTPEQYLVALSTAENAKSVLTAWAFGAHVRDGLLGDPNKRLDALNAACNALRESKELVDLGRVMLSIGNRVNANTARGGAEILSIDSLLKFDNVRSPCDSSMTLLRYCVQKWKKKNSRSPSMVSMFTKLLKPVTHPSTKIPDIKEVDSDVKRIAALSREAKSLLECLRQQPNYESEVIPLIEDGIKKANELQEYLKKTLVNWKLTLQYFCVRNESPVADKNLTSSSILMRKFIILVGTYAAMD